MLPASACKACEPKHSGIEGPRTGYFEGRPEGVGWSRFGIAVGRKPMLKTLRSPPPCPSLPVIVAVASCARKSAVVASQQPGVAVPNVEGAIAGVLQLSKTGHRKLQKFYLHERTLRGPLLGNIKDGMQYLQGSLVIIFFAFLIFCLPVDRLPGG